MLREIADKADVTIRSSGEMKAIDPHIAVRHDTVKFDIDPVAGAPGRNDQMFAIPSGAGGKKSPSAAGPIRLRERTFDAPVMRKIQLAPTVIIESDGFGVS